MRFLSPVCDLGRVAQVVGEMLLFCFMSGVCMVWIDYFAGGI